MLESQENNNKIKEDNPDIQSPVAQEEEDDEYEEKSYYEEVEE